jgi:hypothetical protein
VARHPSVLRRLSAIFLGLEDDNPFIDPDAPLLGVPYALDQGGGPGRSGEDEEGQGRNVFANDPCLDPTPPNRRRTVQSETEIAVLNTDRRRDAEKNILNDVWAAASSSLGRAFGGNVRVTDISTSWYKRADARPNFGDYNSSELIDFEKFATVWADGRFPTGTYVPLTCNPAPPPGQSCPPASAGTPDTLFSIVRGLAGEGEGGEGKGH